MQQKPDTEDRGAGSPAPVSSRPHIMGYGIPPTAAGLLPWEHVVQRLTQSRHYWVCTVSPSGTPHATPVDGLWLDDALYFGGAATTRRQRNLAANPAVCIHLESATDVLILEGTAHELRPVEPALALRLAAASTAKYGYAPPPEAYQAGGIYAFRPHRAFAWTQFPSDATRWTIAPGHSD